MPGCNMMVHSSRSRSNTRLSELVWSFCDRFYVYFDLLTPDLQNARVRWDHLIFQFLRGAALMIRAFLY
ncbi:hypothetical protein C3731_20165, partial [Brucella oryzae]